MLTTIDFTFFRREEERVEGLGWDRVLFSDLKNSAVLAKYSFSVSYLREPGKLLQSKSID